MADSVADESSIGSQGAHGGDRRSARGRRFFHHHVGVGAAEAEGADTRPARLAVRGPVDEARGDEERAVLDVDVRIDAAEVHQRRDLAVRERHRRLDDADHARRGGRMAEVALHRTQRAEVALRVVDLEHVAQGLELDRVAHRRGRAVRFHVAHRRRRDAGACLRGRDHFHLPLDAGCEVALLAGAVVVDGRTLDDGEDGVAVGHRVAQALEHDHARAVREHGRRWRRWRRAGNGRRP